MPQPPDAPDDDAEVPPDGGAQPDGPGAPEGHGAGSGAEAAAGTAAAGGTEAAAGTAHPVEPADPAGFVPPDETEIRIPAPPRDTAPPEATASAPGAGISAPPPPGSRGPGVGAGVGLGCLAHVIGFPVMLGSLLSAMGIWGALWPFYLIAIAAIVGMFFDATRRVSTGVLIVSAASWLVLLGPCVALVGGG